MKEGLISQFADPKAHFYMRVDPTNRCTIPSGKTGWKKDQTFSNGGKELYPIRYIGVNDGKLKFIGEPIGLNPKLHLFGNKGMENAVDIANQICNKLVGTPNLTVMALRKDEEEALPIKLRVGNYLLGTAKINEIFGVRHCGVYCADYSTIYESYLCTSYGEEYLFIADAVRPTFCISEDTKIKIESTAGGRDVIVF